MQGKDCLRPLLLLCPLGNLLPSPFLQRFSEKQRHEQGFFGRAVFGKSRDVLRATFLVVGLCIITAMSCFNLFFFSSWLLVAFDREL